MFVGYAFDVSGLALMKNHFIPHEKQILKYFPF